MMASKNSLRWHESETLRGTRLKRKPVLNLVTLDSAITNNKPGNSI